ncbi:hypothetical protein [Acaryochloris sp. CCMEE 5410]|uniref:hypothetical protein n=1 Tax=Acaryochloris sp. CCMEE 5410 TaxID=310037 RepID=UPI000248435B|nr:hypothetical protein [Acaryochloris sp. CCMEE 5410]KAI9133977.1 hypothetical protein ON05_012265 [Acaryochloris sp. CCMEE 5410]
MAWVNQIKFFYKKRKLYIALFDDSHVSEFWIANIKASDLNIKEVPQGFVLERKYRIQDLGIKPFQCSQDNFLFKVGDFVNQFVKGRSTPNVVVENYMSGDTYNIGQAGAVGKGARSDHNTFHQSEPKQTLAEAAEEIQRLLNVLAVDNPDANESDKITFVNDETTPSFKHRVVSALKSGSETAITEFFDNPYINVGKAIVEGWIKVN